MADHPAIPIAGGEELPAPPWPALKTLADEFAALHPRIPPLPRDLLESDAEALLTARPAFRPFRPLLLLLLHNAYWRPGFSAIPYSRRLLLLPQCLRHPTECRAEFDTLGLLCGACGQCPIAALQETAESLGYAVLVAEGTTAVNLLLEAGGIEAVLGVGCLNALEKLFPLIESAALPALAIPLDRDGCRNTRVAPDAVLAELRAWSADYHPIPSAAELRREIDRWFTPAAWSETIGRHPGETPLEAVRWMAGGGKRWRPLLFGGLYRTLADRPDPALAASVGRAIECFHKASLIHDDIEDQDAVRDGQPALHVRIGLPAALNVGDFLIGEGYRLLAGLPVADSIKARLFAIAAAGHRDLCVGQGLELGWLRAPDRLSQRQLLEIFALKTAPAFSVALHMAAALAGAPPAFADPLDRFSRCVGIAWQIRDDLADPLEPRSDAPFPPHILLALAFEKSDPTSSRALLEALRARDGADRFYPLLRALVDAGGLRQTARSLQNEMMDQARAALQDVDRPAAKWLLYRLLHRMFADPAAPTAAPFSPSTPEPLPSTLPARSPTA